jgi:Domain of unknown function (DUF4333)
MRDPATRTGDASRARVCERLCRCLTATLTLAAGGAALAGCGASSTLDTKAVAHAISSAIVRQRHVTARVTCPARIPRKAGQAFTCTASFDVGSYAVYVTETNGSGHVRFGNPAPLVLLDTERVERAITTSVLAQRRLRATVICPREVLQQAGIAFSCTATVGSRRYPFSVTEINGAGQVRYEGQPSVSGRS